MIKGQATEVIDVGHFLPMAFADWFSRKEMRRRHGAIGAAGRRLAFFRNMLAPVLKAAGYKVRVAVNAQEGLPPALEPDLRRGADRHRDAGHERLRVRRNHPRRQQSEPMPIIALSSLVSPAAIERGRQAGFHDYVAKFDRPGLIAALKEQTAEVQKAACSGTATS